MLWIKVPASELLDEINQEFIYTKDQTLQLEHSLISLAKWESRWKKPYLTRENKTNEEALDYVRCMTLTQNVKPEIYSCLTNENLRQISDYIEDPMTATTIHDFSGGARNREVVTAEIIYYWMIALNIPMECQKWHLNRLMTLIRVCDIKNSPQKKQSARSVMRNQAALNAARRKKWNTKG